MTTSTSKLSEEQYLLAEETSLDKHEFYEGKILAMAGASDAHIFITNNIVTLFLTKLRGGKCQLFNNDKRVKSHRPRSYFYPDITVVCGQQLKDERGNLLNPTIVIEVLSDSTTDYDRGTKAKVYRAMTSLQTYILVEQDASFVEVHQRVGQSWVLTEYVGLDASFEIPVIDLTFSLADIYEGVEFPPVQTDDEL